MCCLANRGEWFTFIGNRVKKIRTARFTLYLASVYCLKHSRVLENTLKIAQLIENRILGFTMKLRVLQCYGEYMTGPTIPRRGTTERRAYTSHLLTSEARLF